MFKHANFFHFLELMVWKDIYNIILQNVLILQLKRKKKKRALK